MQTKPNRIRVGNVAARSIGEGRWIIRYRDPASRRDVRRRVLGVSRKEAEAVCGNINRELLAKGGFIPGERPALPTVDAALAGAIDARNTTAATRRDRVHWSKAFVRWLAEHHPAVKTWDQVKPAMVQAYVLGMERKGKAYDTVRLALAPIRLASRYCVENWPGLVQPLPRIKLALPPKRGVACLEAGETAALLDWLKVQAPDLHGLGCLQALAGLRCLEAASLRARDVDLEAGTITITDTGRHKPKTRDSWRTLPLCSEALGALRSAMERQKVRPMTGEIFVNADGNPWTRTALGHRWTKTLRRASRATGLALARVPAKALRRSFATMAGRLGAPDRLLKAYLGHAAGDMLGDHYRAISPAEMRSVSGLLEGWRALAQGGETGVENGKKPATPASDNAISEAKSVVCSR